MSSVYEWVRSLVFYLILMTMIINLLPDKKYEKYLRLFVGMVFLMLVLSPFADFSGAEEQVAEAFSRLTFQNDAKMLKKEIEDADGARMQKLAERYEEAIEADMRLMAEGMDVRCTGVEIVVDEDLKSGTFGRVVSVDMTVASTVDVPETENQAVTAAEVAKLGKRIGAYYGLKESDIEIHLENE